MSVTTTENPRPSGADVDAEDGFRTRLWTRAEYHRAADKGVFAPGERLELLDGEIIQKTAPQKSAHFSGVTFAADALEAVLAPGFHVRQQGPIIATDSSEPEPDLAVVAGTFRDYVRRHPLASEVRLVVEISDATLSLDRNRKAELYARIGIPDYWIEDVRARTLEILRDPAPDPARSGRFLYQTRTLLRDGDAIAPLHAATPGVLIAVSDFLAPNSETTPSQ